MTTSTTTTNHSRIETPAEAALLPEIVQAQVAQTVVGQRAVVERILIALLTGGHLLLEGVPGLAKTLLVHAVARAIDLRFGRVQFTVDLLPSDILGGEIFDARAGEFRTYRGPIFANLLLADEINRASPKVQSALLEAMQERRVSIGTQSLELPTPFVVIATQNPVEQSGTFELPEAQLDRFMFCHRLGYLGQAEEFEVTRRSLALGLRRSGDGAVPMSAFDAIPEDRKLSAALLTQAMDLVQRVHVSDVFVRDCVELVSLTRTHPDLDLGCSPRAAIALAQASRARAMIQGRDYVTPEDLFELAEDVLLHRMRLRYEAVAAGRRAKDVLAEVLERLT